jgi:hypothetical protein
MNRLVLFVYGVAAAILMCAGTALGDVKELCVGVWKGGASGLSKETYLVVRTDGTGTAFGVSERGEQKKAYEFEFEPDGDVLKLKNRWAMRKGKRRDYNDRNEGRLWVEVKSGKLMMSDGTHMKSFERARDIEDPFRRNAGKSLKDSFHVDTRGSGFVRAFFQTGYSERGPQPADADVLVSEWRNSRPRGIVDPKRTFRNGVDKIKDSVQAYKGVGITCGEGWQVRSRGMWHSWTENAMMDWNTAKADNEAFIKLLELRFEGRFPCKGTVLTIRTKK